MSGLAAAIHTRILLDCKLSIMLAGLPLDPVLQRMYTTFAALYSEC